MLAQRGDVATLRAERNTFASDPNNISDLDSQDVEQDGQGHVMCVGRSRAEMKLECIEQVSSIAPHGN